MENVLIFYGALVMFVVTCLSVFFKFFIIIVPYIQIKKRTQDDQTLLSLPFDYLGFLHHMFSSEVKKVMRILPIYVYWTFRSHIETKYTSRE